MKPLCALVVGLSFIVSTTRAAAEDLKCPISGKQAKEDIFLEVNGQKVNFCCENCPKAYKQKINLVEEAGEKKCPLEGCGKPGSSEQTSIIRTAKAVAFCCNNCPKEFAKRNKFEIKEEAPKTCPISGKPAKDEEGTSLVVNGNKVFFCCGNCPKAYKKKLGVTEAAATCCISGKPAKEETAQILIQSKVVSFCCADCKAEFAKKHFKDGAYVEGEAKAEKSAEPKKKSTL